MKKKCTLKQDAYVNIGRLILKTDSLTESLWMSGKLTGAGDDYLKIQLQKVTDKKEFATGQFETNTTSYGVKKMKDKTTPIEMEDVIPFDEIDFIEFTNPGRNTVSGIGEGILMTSLVALLIGPLVSIDYGAGEFNADRYKVYTLSVTGAMLVGFSLEMFSGRVKRQIRADWPEKDAKPWSVKK
jgi:hypothetical protein